MPELSPWARNHFEPGGGDALLLYYVYGSFPGRPSCSHERHRTRGAPAGTTLQRYDRARHAGVLDGFLTGHFRAFLDRQPALAPRVTSAPECLVLRGTVPNPPDLGYLRDAVGLIACLLEWGGVAVLDPQTLSWWEPDDWRRRFFDPNAPVPHDHVVILASEDGPGRTWFHTRGLRKFGRPDLSAHGVEPPQHDGIVELFTRFIEFQAHGGVIPEGREVRMAGLPPGLTCHHRGNVDDPDFNNRHVELVVGR